MFVGQACKRRSTKFSERFYFCSKLVDMLKDSLFSCLADTWDFWSKPRFFQTKDSKSSIKILIKDFCSSKLLLVDQDFDETEKGLMIRFIPRVERNQGFLIFFQFLQVFFSLILVALPWWKTTNPIHRNTRLVFLKHFRNWDFPRANVSEVCLGSKHIHMWRSVLLLLYDHCRLLMFLTPVQFFWILLNLVTM